MHFIGDRFRYAIQSYPLRWTRLISHLFFISSYYKPVRVYWYDRLFDLMFYILDVLLIPDFLDIIYSGFIQKRKIALEEIERTKDLFGESLNYQEVYIVETRRPYKKGLFFAFVSFNTINCIKEIPIAVLAHELVHIWQYQRYGSIYIFRALRAQNSKEGYDYGGVFGLDAARSQMKSLDNFNFEQQAQIVEDYFERTQLGNDEATTKALYEYFIGQLVRNDDIFVA